jgi:hypothetical protein
MQNVSHLLMIKPLHFGFNEETASTNYFQQNILGNHQQKALKEFEASVTLLQKNNILVTVINDNTDAITPDAIFPNNWISFDKEKGIYLYPMYAQNRRLEKNEKIIHSIKPMASIQKITDLSYFEKENKFLEGTGSMVLDREHKIAYACLSPRTAIEVLNEFCKQTNYSSCTFISTDINDKEIYHTNVMMCVADKYVVICLESIKNRGELDTIKKTIEHTNKEIIEITIQQINCFAGNMLQVKNKDGIMYLLMSTTAYQSLTTIQIEKLEKYNTILHTNINTIETIGGGSVRCMLAEIV